MIELTLEEQQLLTHEELIQYQNDLIEFQRQEYFKSINITGEGIEKYEQHFGSSEEDGRLHHKIVRYVFEDGVVISKRPWRQVLNKEKEPYSDKLTAVIEKIHGTLAQLQNEKITENETEIEAQSQAILQKTAEANGLAELRDELSQRLEEEVSRAVVKDDKIEELEKVVAQVDIKDNSIQELQAQGILKDNRITELEAHGVLRDNRIIALEEEIQTLKK